MFGLAAALGVGPWLSSLLFGLPPRDGFVVATAAAALALTGALANWLPARRAARIDPVRSLRTE
jgi:ABC-type antimicrobial peptide transport system permease subunit